MLREMTAIQFFEWYQYSLIEPFGEFRDDLRTSFIAQHLVNPHRDKKQKPDGYHMVELYLFFKKEMEKFLEQEITQTPAQQAAMARSIAASWNKSLEKRKPSKKASKPSQASK